VCSVWVSYLFWQAYHCASGSVVYLPVRVVRHKAPARKTSYSLLRQLRTEANMRPCLTQKQWTLAETKMADDA
jgi:hypothetical protein